MKKLRKYAFSFVAASCIVVGSIPVTPVAAEEYAEKTVGDFTVHEYSTYVEIAEFNNAEAKSITIPSEIDGLPVISIGEAKRNLNDLFNISYIGSFAKCQADSIILPSTLISIGNYAFSSSKIKTIEIPDSVLNIKEGAFMDCTDLISVKCSKQIQEISAQTFSGCVSLKEFNFPAALTKISHHAFQNTALTAIQFPDSLQVIENGAFYQCSSLQSVKLPEKIKEISTFPSSSDGAFQECIALKEIHIPAATTIYGNAFKGCTALEKLTFDEGATQTLACFDGCKSLKKVEIPKSFNTCPSFNNCTALTSVTFADNTTTTGSFQDCVSLEEITLPDSVKNFGEYGKTAAFQNCAKLKRIVINNPDCKIYDSRSSISNYTLNGTSYFNGTIYGTEGSTAQKYAEKYGYKFAIIGSEPEIILGDVNNDGEISVEDAQLALVAYVNDMSGKDNGLTDEQFCAADVNKNGELSVDDAQNILIYYVTSTVSGKEITWDELLKSAKS